MTLRRLGLLLAVLALSTNLSAVGAPGDSIGTGAAATVDLEAAGLDEQEVASEPPTSIPTGTLVDADLVAIEGQSGGGSTIDGLNSPFTNSSGQAAFTGSLLNGDNFVWFDDAITWLNSDNVGELLTGGESTMGVSDSGGFIYSPAVDGDDAVWTDAGLLLRENTQAPDFPAGTNSTFHSRPTMIPDGRAYWVAGFNESGGTATEGRMLYTSSDATAGNTTVVLRSDDVIDTFTIDRSSGVGFDYDFSEDGGHHIHELLMDTGSTVDDGFIYVDGSLVARETGPTGDGDNWDNFDVVSINNSGDYLFSGDTDGATGSDEFIALNGVITLREGDTVDGIPLAAGSSVQALSLADNGAAVHLWSTGATEVLFAACSVANLAGSQVLLQVGTSWISTTTGSADGEVTDFNASTVIGPGLDLANDGTVLVEIDLDQGAGDIEATVRLTLPCEIFSDGFESGDTGSWSSTTS